MNTWCSIGNVSGNGFESLKGPMHLPTKKPYRPEESSPVDKDYSHFCNQQDCYNPTLPFLELLTPCKQTI